MRKTHHFALDFPRPSHILWRNKWLTGVVTVAAVAMGVVAALQPGWLLELDRPLTDAFRGESLEGFFRFWNRLGSQQDMGVLALVFAVLLWPTCRPFAVALPTAVLLGVVLDVTLKVVVDRPRPPDAVVGTALGSFPSGHALTGVIFFGLVPPALWIALRRRVVFWISVPVSVVTAVLVVSSRVYLGAHWPSDVLASIFIGASVLLLTEYALGGPFARAHCDGCSLHRARAETGVHDEAPRQTA